MSTLSRSIVLAVVAAVLAGAQPAAGQRAQPGPLRLVFESNRTGTWQVYSVPASGGALAQLTFAAAGARNPRPSPDGRTLLVERSGGIWLLRADGTQPRPLVAAGHSAAWSRDGRKFAYVGPAARAGIHVYELRTRRARRVTSDARDAQPSWSPDGRSLLFVRRAADHTAFGSVVVRRNGVERTLALEATGPAWSPDGRVIAFTQQVRDAEVWRYDVVRVRPDGSSRRQLLTRNANFRFTLAWSPDSRRLAVPDLGRGLVVVDATSGSARVISSEGGPERAPVAWSPAGNELAFVRYPVAAAPHADVQVLSLTGSVRTLARAADGDEQGAVAWTRPPRGTRYRPAQPVPPLQQASPRELRARRAIRELSADGGRVAYELCGVSSWRPGGRIVGPHGLNACSSEAYARRGAVGKVTLGGGRIAYAVASGGTSRGATLYLSRVEAPWPGVQVASSGASTLDVCCSPLLPRLGYVLGDGPFLVVSTWTLTTCQAGPPWERCVETQTVWRIGESGVPEEVARGSGTLEPVSVDGARVVVRRASGEIAVLTERGVALLALPFAPGEAVAAELSGRDLVVVVPGGLRHYDAGTGRLVEAWPLPHVPAGGFCGLWTACDSLDLLLGNRLLVLEDLARGIVAYRLHGELRLLRLRDGAEASVGPAISARLEDEGLFYSYRGDEPWPGRIRFVPFDELPLRP